MSVPANRGAPALVVSILAVALALVGCDSDGITGANGSDPAQFSRDISYEELETLLTSGETVRLEIELNRNGPPLIAREVQVGESGELSSEEQVESRVADPGITNLNIGAGACSGTLTLELENVQVQFDGGTTRFEIEEGDSERELTCAEFVDAVQVAVAAGRGPFIKADRPPMLQDGAQAGDDPVFMATNIEIENEDDDERSKLELNVGDANLVGCDVVAAAPAGCLGVLLVLGESIVLQDGVTELEAEDRDGDDGDFDFEGFVALVEPDPDDPGNAARALVTLTDGRLVRIVEGTEFDDDSGDDDQLGSLAAVQAALDGGQIVEIEGEGMVETTDPVVTIVAFEVEFEIKD